jgi:Protein of unknown function (DUF2905)
LSSAVITGEHEARHAAPFTLRGEHHGAQTPPEAGLRRDTSTTVRTTVPRARGWRDAPRLQDHRRMGPELGRVLLIVGIVLVVVGGLSVMGVRMPFGRLPGDIVIQGERGTIYIPITSMILISLVLTLVANFFFRR